MKLLISGSRDASVKMLEMAWSAVHEMYLHGNEIVVGDAQGIDRRVIEACLEIGVPFTAYGVSEYGRFPDLVEDNYVRVITNSHPKRAYLERDEYMARYADEGLFIWNGVSRGTKYTHDYMKKLGKPVKLYDFSLDS